MHQCLDSTVLGLDPTFIWVSGFLTVTTLLSCLSHCGFASVFFPSQHEGQRGQTQNQIQTFSRSWTVFFSFWDILISVHFAFFWSVHPNILHSLQLRHSPEISSNFYLASIALWIKNSFCSSTCIEILEASQFRPGREVKERKREREKEYYIWDMSSKWETHRAQLEANKDTRFPGEHLLLAVAAYPRIHSASNDKSEMNYLLPRPRQIESESQFNSMGLLIESLGKCMKTPSIGEGTSRSAVVGPCPPGS